MQETITTALKQVETDRQVRILYACESGSRAWGFPSPDSDYDVRFIYAHPADWYFSIDERKDTIELPVNELLDVGGWDIRKALQQFRKCNAAVFEWLQSPIVYRENPEFTTTLRGLMPAYFAPRAVVFHHLGLVRKVLEETEKDKDIRLKKIFYILRSLLSASWVRENGTVPPMTFEPLQELIKEKIIQEKVIEWLELKNQSDEKTRVKKLPFFEEYVLMEMARCEAYGESAPANKPTSDQLKQLFRKTVTGR